MPGGGARDGGDEAGVVDELAVPVHVAEPQPLAADARYVGGHAPRAHDPRAREAVGAGPRQAREQRARHEPQSRQHRAERRRVAEHRHHLGERSHQVGSGAVEEDAALDGRAARDPDVAGGQIAQPTVGELGRPAARPERQVVRLEQHHLEPARGGVQGDAGAGDAAADHDEVDGGRSFAQVGELAGAAGGGQGGVGRGGRGHGIRYPRMSRWSSVRQVTGSSGGSASGADRTAPWTAR